MYLDNPISIIIPTFNRNDIILKTLPSYLKQKNILEIIIVDDGSRIPTEKIFRINGLRDEKVRFIRHNRNLGLSIARNSGINEVKSKYLFFGEDDLMLSDDHIEILLREKKKLDADLICGRIIQQEENESIDESLAKETCLNRKLLNDKIIAINYTNFEKPIELPFAHAIFLAETELVRKYLFSTRIGGPSFYREDQDMQLAMRKDGYRLFCVPEAVCFHLSRKKGYGSGARAHVPALIYIASCGINTWQVINEYHKIIAPFFNNMEKKRMLQKAIFWTIILQTKRIIQVKYNLIDKLISFSKKLKNKYYF